MKNIILIIVWNATDIIAMFIIGLTVLIVAILFGVAWIQDKWNSWKRGRKKH